ncbi:hypothetical protein U1Q18_007879 [Sarracenia purpurea var. burkii]
MEEDGTGGGRTVAVSTELGRRGVASVLGTVVDLDGGDGCRRVSPWLDGVALMMVGAVGEDARDKRPMMAGPSSGLKEMKGDKNPLVYSLSQTKNNPGKATLYPLCIFQSTLPSPFSSRVQTPIMGFWFQGKE